MKTLMIPRKSLVASAMFVLVLVFWFAHVGQAREPMHKDRMDMWGPNWVHRDRMGGGNWTKGDGHHQRMRRHRTYMQSGVPKEYAGKTNPLTPEPHIIGTGQSLYAQNCASCHGAQGMGDGEAGKALNPSPALLAHMIKMPMFVDEYLLWAISEGGQPFGTAMPAFKDALNEDDIWKIVSYMRAGFTETPAQ